MPAPVANASADKVVVAVRMREAQPSEGPPCLRMTRDACELQLPGKDGAGPSGARTTFRFDRCFWSSRGYASGNPVAAQAAQEAEEASQTGVYQGVGYHVLHHVTAGHTACLVTYGATGSGKSYTAFGPGLLGLATSARAADDVGAEGSDTIDSDRGDGDDAHPTAETTDAATTSSSSPSELVPNAEAGLVPRLCRDLLEAVRDACRAEGSDIAASLRVSVLEVLNEQVFDLTTAGRRRLEVHEAKPASGGVGGGSFFAEGAEKIPVKSESDAARVLAAALARRTVASHSLNDASSRAHTLVTLEFRKRVGPGRYRASRATIADLAGNERVAVAKSLDTKAMLKQATNINLSLLTLGTCISVIVSRMKSGLPQGVVTQFRNSTLTKLLKDSIAGNSHLSLLCTVAPSSAMASQTLHTLRFADSAKHLECRHLALAHVERDDQAAEGVAAAPPADGELPQLAQARAAVGRSAGKRRRTAMAVQVVQRLAGVYERQERSHRASVVVEQAQGWSSLLARAKIFFGPLMATSAGVAVGTRKPLYPPSLSSKPKRHSAATTAAVAATPRPPLAEKKPSAAPPRRSVVSFVAATPTPMKPQPPPPVAASAKKGTAPRRQPSSRATATSSSTTTTTTYRIDANGNKTVVGTSSATTTKTATNAVKYSSSPALDRVQAALRKEHAREAKAKRERCASDEHKGRATIVSAEARVRTRFVSGEKEIRAKVLKEQGLRARQRRSSELQWAVRSPTATTTTATTTTTTMLPTASLHFAAVWDLVRPAYAAQGRYSGVAAAAEAAGLVRITAAATAPLVAAACIAAPPVTMAAGTPSPRSVSGYADDSADADDSHSAAAASSTSLAPTPRSEPLSDASVRSPTPPPLSRSASIRSPTPPAADLDADDEVASHVASSRPLTAASSIPPTPSPVASVAAESDAASGVSVPVSPAATSRAPSSIPPTPSPSPRSSRDPSPSAIGGDDEGEIAAANGSDDTDEDPYGDDFDDDENDGRPAATEEVTTTTTTTATAKASAVGLAGVADADAIRAQLEADEGAAREREAAERASKAALVGPASDEVRPIAPVEGSDDVLDACDVFQSIETPEALSKVAATMACLVHGGAASVVLNAEARDALRAVIVSALGAGDSDAGSEAEAAMIAATLELFATLKHIDCSSSSTSMTALPSVHASPLVAEWCADDEWLEAPMLSTTATSRDARPLAAVLTLIDGAPDVHRSATAEWGLALARRVAAAPVSVHKTEPRWSAVPALLRLAESGENAGSGKKDDGSLPFLPRGGATGTKSVVCAAVWCRETAPLWADAVRRLALDAPPYDEAAASSASEPAVVAGYVRALRQRLGADFKTADGEWNGYDAVA